MDSFEIFLSDLNEEAQKRYLAFQGVESADDLNGDICPLAIIDKSDEEDETCKRCGTSLNSKGFCEDETCPYSDRLQTQTFTEE
jgi:hypothetical protein